MRARGKIRHLMSDPAPRGFARLGFDWLDRGIRDRAARPGFPGWAGLGFDIRPGPGWVRLIGFDRLGWIDFARVRGGVSDMGAATHPARL
jgi:hypothetical protein